MITGVVSVGRHFEHELLVGITGLADQHLALAMHVLHGGVAMIGAQVGIALLFVGKFVEC